MSDSSAPPRVDRVSDADLAFLAMDRGPVPEQIAVVLLLDRRLRAAAFARLLRDRAAAVPRLRQRLVRTPPGCGAPIWVDDEAFDAGWHLVTAQCPGPGSERAMLEAVLPHVLRPLPRERPLWRAVLVDGLADGCTAVVFVVHHALSDGLGGLAALGRLLDGDSPETLPPPSRRPTAWRLAADAWRSRAAALRAAPASLRRLRTAMAAGGGMAAVRAQPCSLLRVTGARRRVAVARVRLDALRTAAHRHHAGVHAALLAAVAEALHDTLARRGETVATVRVAVPVGTPRVGGATAGNAVSPLVVAVPVTGPLGVRLSRVAADVRRGRAAAAGPAPITVLGGGFRLLAALGGYRWYMTHQRRLHTLVSYLRGPAGPVRLGGTLVREMIPIVVGGNANITVSFVALSYAGSLAVTAVADSDGCPDLEPLSRQLAAELNAIAAEAPSGRR
ncbi:wax ester/triacylglycerol synthase domain-containing protein [Actinoplanes sp. NPDC049118]|uniref:wax ester/triacylglycerol synthase domain-containing protein n=1 Tax=Actinoplanes sp. NPDC049118 TaxID=3155769 RepID=UPI0033FFD405